MSSIVEDLKRLCGAVAKGNELDLEISAATGLTVVHDKCPTSDDLLFWRTLEPLILRRDFPALAQICRSEFQAKRRFGNGRSRAELGFNALLAPIEQADLDPTASEDELAAYKAWWQQDRRNPAAAGLYAVALAMTGFGYRGVAWANTVTDSQWALLRDFSSQAEDVLDHASGDRDACWIWNFSAMRARFIAFGIGEASARDLRLAFDATRHLDPRDVSVYEERVSQLLPRWGGSFEDLNALALRAYADTKDAVGAEMYARVYDTVVKWEDPAETLIDYDLLHRGFADWLARCPSEPLANRFAAHAYSVGDIDTVATLFETAIHEIHPRVWFGPRQPLLAWDACLQARRRPTRR